MVKGLFRLYWETISNHAGLVLFSLGLCVALMAYHAKDFKLDASADALLLENDQDLKVWRETQKRYGSSELLIVGIAPKADVFSNEGLSLVQRLTEDLGRVPSIESVFSLLDAPLFGVQQNSTSTTGGSSPAVAAGAFPTLVTPGIDRAKARDEILSSPLFSELLVNGAGTVTGLLLKVRENPELAEFRHRRDELRKRQDAATDSQRDATALREVTAAYDQRLAEHNERMHADIAQIRAILGRYNSEATIHLGGTPMIADDMLSFIRGDLLIFGIGIAGFVIVTLSLLFRRLQWIVLPLASCAFASTIMLGILGLFGWKVTVISSNFISLMWIMTMSMNIHIVVRFRQIQQAYPEHDTRRWVRSSLEALARPCLYTALTTIIGFSSLVFSDIKPVIDFGYMMSLGIAVTYVTSFVLFPSLLLVVGPPPAPSGREIGRASITSGLARFTLRQGRTVIVAAIGLGALSVWGIYQLKVENSFVDYFRADTEIYRGMKVIDEHLGGTTPLDVLIRFDEPAEPDCVGKDCEYEDELLDGEPTNPADGWFTQLKTDKIRIAHDYLDALPEVGKVLSLTTVLRAAKPVNEGRDLNSFDISVLYRRMPESLRRDTFDAYISLTDNEARVAARLLDSRPDIHRDALLEKIKTELPLLMDIPPKNVSVSGTLVLYNNMLQSLFQSQLASAGAVILGIGVMFFVLFRSLSVAIIGTVPNVLAAALVLGIMGLLSIPLDIMTITIAAITIGIAVDDSIHYLYRFRERLDAQLDYEEALVDCHATVGQAMLYTSVTVIFGFSILVFSNFVPTIYFGTLTGVAMAAALVASLTLLPRLILTLRPF